MLKKILLIIFLSPMLCLTVFAANPTVPLSDPVFDWIRDNVIWIDALFPEANIIVEWDVDTVNHDNKAVATWKPVLPAKVHAAAADKAAADKAAADKAAADKTKCRYDPNDSWSWSDARFALEGCVADSALVQPADLYVSGWLKDVINWWIAKIAWFLALGAMFAIAFGSLRLTLSMWEDENIKKAKDIIKWWILGFLAVISAGLLISTVVNVIYSIG